jgi:hypothetical protein
VAIAHSYGGQVCTNALHGLGLQARSSQGLRGGVSALIYMASYALTEGLAGFDKTKEFDDMDIVPVVFDIADDQTSVVRNPKGALVDPGVDEAEAEEFFKNVNSLEYTRLVPTH